MLRFCAGRHHNNNQTGRYAQVLGRDVGSFCRGLPVRKREDLKELEPTLMFQPVSDTDELAMRLVVDRASARARLTFVVIQIPGAPVS